MKALRLIFSPLGRLRRWPFLIGAIIVYAAGAASQSLTVPDVIAAGGVWPFAAAQALLIWIWFALHAKRLHDVGRTAALAAAAALLYALALALLLIIGTAFFATSVAIGGNASSSGALELLLLISILSTLSGSNAYDLGSLIVAILLILAFLPSAVAVGVTLWVATLPGSKDASM